jgi:CRISPR-associated exonuclease Cas4
VIAEDDLLPLSGLQHFTFCERRWALIYIESVWAENRFTAEGKVLHEKAHSGDVESRPGVLIRRTLPLHSFRLGISGEADIVEFHPVKSGEAGISLEGRKGLWRPYPVEYKRSRDKAGSIAYKIQLCAQALCLEEMLQTAVPEGAVFDDTQHRRQIVAFDDTLRHDVETIAVRMHELRRSGSTPSAVYEKRCDSCSLLPLCLPKTLSSFSASKYLRNAVHSANTSISAKENS